MKTIKVLNWIYWTIPDWVYGKKWFGGLILALLLGYALSKSMKKAIFAA